MASPEPDFETTVELVMSAQRGSRDALELLLARHLPYVRQIVALRMGWRLQRLYEVDDLVQQVMIRVLESIDRIEARSNGAFRNFLSKCVECEISDVVRASGREKRGGDRVRRFGDYGSALLRSSILAGEGATPSEVARGRELAERLEDAILALPEHQRELIVLHALCGMSYSEVADELGITRRDSVRVACFRALRRLRKMVGA